VIILAEGTRWQSEARAVRSAGHGGTVVVVAGVHGDEPAGPLAATALLDELIQRGCLWVIPRANPPALLCGTRLAPDTEHPNLNRNFPRGEGEEPRGEAALAIWSFVMSVQPDYVVDLHEGYDFNCRNRKSVGSSVLVHGPAAEAAARRVQDAVNATISDDDRKFTLIRRTARGSLVRAASERGIRALLLETTKRERSVDERAAQHLTMVRQLLADAGLLDQSRSAWRTSERRKLQTA
jgi:predicted deacylase